ncbi:Protein involved in biosynthesis of mitomycin antibiotics/polyketide fumonisin [Oopsacas minuta]|uniref:Protein involved in biosynthesis of mitomycin antibiotics/polyketide fumonisin n=1 Tax=Oopsacas minuta TaxID=111878 RepID=A0AAV7K2K8_9METZ|nr:Protein involved in biosynthesis of mitomycin antibiotics/polyketide fumonisin [Oopsacas minuta]
MDGVTVSDLEVKIEDLDITQAVSIYNKYGCLIVRRLNAQYVDSIYKDAEVAAEHAVSLLSQAVEKSDGWETPDGTLFIPVSPEYESKLGRDKQIMVLGVNYMNSAAMTHAAMDKQCLDIVEGILGPNIELFGNGQCFYKEPAGGNPKYLHQDNAYFEFAHEGPVGTLNYTVDTNLKKNNGPLYVIPGTHRKGGYGYDKTGAYSGQTPHSSYIKHVDTSSHLALNLSEWSFDDCILIEGNAGDTIFFHINLVHGSPPNHSDSPRPTFINRYLSVDDYPVMPLATSVKMRLEQLEKFKKEGGAMKKRGIVVRGRRQYIGMKWQLDNEHH